ncbi:hypothetical protein A3K86_15185 [Photobacterium jeanii]|uniref:Uncharacterized protein n=1 Tax=Photobacterium jeanii TaxID=858640 RepID=A0A178K6Q9_9GAMM|nr:hypothetical protein [Photobacterium jeanii]OAN13010.1 hypothetical protein A3K86_15185 [Photobacterium jeanii]PST89158.1 hypothetical protein C9I91_13630 [Photobacterium jeanii]
MKKLLIPALFISLFSVNAMANNSTTENQAKPTSVVCQSAKLTKASNNMDGIDAANYHSCKMRQEIQEGR